MLFVGDIHGDLTLLPKGYVGDVVQVGDFGIGFIPTPELEPNTRFIRGNHDNPEACRVHPSYIGDWKVENDILYISGAWSIDFAIRTPFVNWWPDEELTFSQMNSILNVDERIEMVVSHDVPSSVYSEHLSSQILLSATPEFLEEVLNKFNPKVWVAGHHHVSKEFSHSGCKFHMLGIGEKKEIGQ